MVLRRFVKALVTAPPVAVPVVVEHGSEVATRDRELIAELPGELVGGWLDHIQAIKVP